jgi:hypothetical protein
LPGGNLSVSGKVPEIADPHFFNGWFEARVEYRQPRQGVYPRDGGTAGPGIARGVQRRLRAGQVVCVEELSPLLRQVGLREVEIWLGRRGACVPAPVAAGEMVVGLVDAGHGHLSVPGHYGDGCVSAAAHRRPGFTVPAYLQKRSAEATRLY